MNQNSQQPIILDIKDLIFVLLKKIWIIILSGVVFALLIIGFKYYSFIKSSQNNDDLSVLDISNKLSGESDVDFLDRVHNVNHAKDLINNIDVFNFQIENQRTYVSDSVFMQINSENEAVTTANLIIQINDTNITGSDLALVSSYQQYILSGEYLDSLADELGIKQGYLTELIKVEYKTANNVINANDNTENVGIISLTVIGTTTDLTNRIMDIIIDSAISKCEEYNKTMPSHTISVAARQSTYLVDNNTRDRQINVTNRFESLQQQITNFDKALDGVANSLGLSKSSLYAYYSFDDSEISSSSFSTRSVIKYSLVGFVLGSILVLLYISFDYLFNKKFSTQACFFCRFNGLKNLGVVKPDYKRSRYIRFIDIKSGDDNELSPDKYNVLLSANIKNTINGMNKVLITGTADISKIRDLIMKLGIIADVKDSIFVNPECLEKIKDYDGIILVEQRNYSDCKKIAEEIRFIENANIKLIGAVVL